MRTVFIDDYQVYEDEQYLKQESDIKDTALDIYDEFMSADADGYQNEAKVIFKVGGKHYLVSMQAEVKSSWTDYGDVYHIGDITDVDYEEVSVKERDKYLYEISSTFEGSAKDITRIKKVLSQLGIEIQIVSKSKLGGR